MSRRAIHRIASFVYMPWLSYRMMHGEYFKSKNVLDEGKVGGGITRAFSETANHECLRYSLVKYQLGVKAASGSSAYLAILASISITDNRIDAMKMPHLSVWQWIYCLPISHVGAVRGDCGFFSFNPYVCFIFASIFLSNRIGWLERCNKFR